MDFSRDKSFVMAKRLKQLREQKGLSHDKLSKVLFDQYGVKISSDSLINYEVADNNHTKAYKNQGMRVEYLRCLSDYYGVSSDYLLGISDIKSSDPNIETIVKTTGITEENTLFLQHVTDVCNRKIFTPQANSKLDKAKTDADEFNKYLLSEFNQDAEFKKKFVDRHGTTDTQILADAESRAYFAEERELILSEMCFSESLPLEALNALIQGENRYHILRNVALFLLSEPQRESKIMFTAASSTQDGMICEVDGAFLIAGQLACIDNGLQELRKTMDKRIVLCDVDSISKNEAH